MNNNVYFASPESVGLREEREMTGAMDIWGLGCCLYLMLTGAPAFANPERGDLHLMSEDMRIRAHQNQCAQVRLRPVLLCPVINAFCKLLM